METREPIHITVKWPSRDGLPELMVNLYVQSAAQAAAHLEELAALGVTSRADLSAPSAPALDERGQLARQAATTRYQKPDDSFAPEPFVDEWEEFEEPAPSCPTHQDAMLRSKKRKGEWYCPRMDEGEEGGYCRMVKDSKGLRRKPTAAEYQASQQGSANRAPNQQRQRRAGGWN